MRTNIQYILLLFTVFFIGKPVFAQEIDTVSKPKIPAVELPAFKEADSTSILQPLQLTEQDSVKTDSVKVKKESSLTADVIYSAEDYIRFDRKNERVYLYNEAEITYGDVKISAGLIILDNQKEEVYAFGVEDSLGNYTQKPVFEQVNNKVEPDSIRFNFKTEKALVYNSRTKQGDFNVKGQITKRENDSVIFMRNVKFTTAQDIDNPDYYFYARKIKMVPDKKIVAGLVNMYIADVPTPLGLPFGYFPLTDERASGFIIPSFGDNRNRGYFLMNGGYYFAVSEYFDFAALGDYYTNGSYALRLESNYALRYNFRGNLSFRYERLLNSERGFPDFSESSIYNIRWSHTQDPKANPNSRFSASVNLGSSRYYQETINQTNTGSFLNNNLSSSVSYSKRFPGEPEINLNIAATHNQNTQTQEINMTLPTVQASLSRIYPFEPKTGAKKGIIQNINFQYNFKGENRFKTSDSLFFKPEMFKTARTGIQHSIPISTNFKLFNYFSVSTGTNFQENWVFKTYEKSYDEQNQEVITDTISGFDAYRTYNFNANIGTTVYGKVNFKKGSKIQAIRHVIKPNLSYNINPSFDRYYDTYLIPGTAGLEDEIREYSRFESSLYGAPNKNYSSSLGFSVTNDFEAKVKAKDTLEEEPRKIKLLSNLQFNTSYDFAADSIQFQPVSFRGTLPIIQNKLDVNFNGALDPYALDNNNQIIDEWNINNGGSLFRLTRANVSFGYSFSSTDFEGGEKNTDELENETFRNGGRPDDLFGKGMDLDGTFYDEKEEDDEPVTNDTERYHYKIPWNLRLSYTMTYNNTARQNEISSHSLMFSGDVELSPRWSVGASSGYDIKNKGFTYTQLRFSRDLESWRMSFNWTPFGIRESWYFFIGIKANVLSDIKYDKNRERDRNL